MNLSPQQDRGVLAAKQWLRDPCASPEFKMFGYAGTGKTTLAKTLASGVSGTVLYAAYTGKAALQLRKKGCEGASTIHSLIYKPEQCQITGEVKFTLNRESELASASLLVVDEVSMVDDTLARDLLSFGTKILVLGDPAQLPPVKGQGYFINGEPDVMLTEVHRQAADNPIVRLSMDVREGRGLKPGQYGDSLVVRRNDLDDDRLREMILGSDQVLRGLNRTRAYCSGRIRELKGLSGYQLGWRPAAGDRLICLRNNREKNLFNGGLWEVASVRDRGRKQDMTVVSEDEDRAPVNIRVFDEFFNGTEQSLDWRKRRDSDEFTFGWAITCHKSQGSEWDNVFIFDESGSFRDARDKWAYTAVTRAAQRVTVVV